MSRIVVDGSELDAAASYLADAADACDDIAHVATGALEGLAIPGEAGARARAVVADAQHRLCAAATGLRSESADLRERSARSVDDGSTVSATTPGTVGASGGPGPSVAASGVAAGSTAALFAALVQAMVARGPVSASPGTVVVGGGSIAAFAGLGAPSTSFASVPVVTGLITGSLGALGPDPKLLGTNAEIIGAFSGHRGPAASARRGLDPNVTNDSFNGLQDPNAPVPPGSPLGGLNTFTDLYAQGFGL